MEGGGVRCYILSLWEILEDAKMKTGATFTNFWNNVEEISDSVGNAAHTWLKFTYSTLFLQYTIWSEKGGGVAKSPSTKKYTRLHP